MKESWGWDGSSKSWDTWIIVTASYSNIGYADSKGTHNQLEISLTFCTSEKEWEELKKMNETKLNTELKIDANLSEFGENLAGASEGLDNFKEILSNLQSDVVANPIGTAFSYVLGLIRDGIGDSLQRLANTITFTDAHITYSEEELTTEGSKTARYNDYVNVGDYEKNGVTDEENQKIINIKKIKSDKDADRRFSEDTEIPIVMIDLYNIAADNIPFFDVNFLTVDEEKHPEGTPWRYLRDFITSVVHIVIFVVAAVLIIMLIYNGIKIVIHSFDSPEAKAEYKKGINKFATSLFMLVGSVVIMALCVFGSNMFLEDVKVKDSKEGPIRVNVQEADYSFSTNITGFFRYMAGIEGVNRCLEKGAYTIAYIVVSFINLLLAAFMMIRTLGMMVLAIVGPVLAGLQAMNIKSPMKYTTWVRMYVCLAAVQLIFVIVYQVIFGLTIPRITNI